MTKNHRNFGKGSHGGRWPGKWWSGGRGSGGQVVGEVVVNCGGRLFCRKCNVVFAFLPKMCTTSAVELRCCKGKCYAEIVLLDWAAHLECVPGDGSWTTAWLSTKIVVSFWLSRFGRFHWFRLVICLVFELQHNEIAKGVAIA